MTEEMGATILYTGEKNKEAFIKKLGISKKAEDRIVVTHFGCDSNDLRISKSAARMSLEIPIDCKVALFFGLIRNDKLPFLAVQAVSLTKNWWILLAGLPYSYTSDEINTWISNFGLKNRSRLLLKYLAENEITEVFSAADILIAPHNRTELSNSGPLALALTYRLPVIVAYQSYISKIVEEDEIGLIAQRENSSSFADKLSQFSDLSENEIEHIISQIEKKASKDNFDSTIDDYIRALDISLRPR